MNPRIKGLAEQAELNATLLFNKDKLEKFALFIVRECADWVRTNYDSWDAEPLAFNMEKDFGLHGDYAE